MKDLSNKNIVHICKDEIEYIVFRKLLEYPEISHCYTLRKNGISFKRYGEDNSILYSSYDKISKALGFERDGIVKSYQTHTDKIEKVTKEGEEFSEVDGVITNKQGITLCTTSADCTALIFFDPIKKVIADVHSGWRGTLQKIGQKAVMKMKEEYGSKPENIICCICPHIKKCHFEVDEDVKNLFYNEFEYTGKIDEIIKLGKMEKNDKETVQKYNIDTTLINILLLKEVGLKEENIIDSGLCTVCNSKEFHSYRVDKDDSGRNGALICLN